LLPLLPPLILTLPQKLQEIWLLLIQLLLEQSPLVSLHKHLKPLLKLPQL
jgi:hypothetical protein